MCGIRIVEGHRCGHGAPGGKAQDADPIRVHAVFLRMFAHVANRRVPAGYGKLDDGRDDVVQLSPRHQLTGWIIGLAFNEPVFQHETSDASGVEPAGDVESLTVDRKGEERAARADDHSRAVRYRGFGWEHD